MHALTGTLTDDHLAQLRAVGAACCEIGQSLEGRKLYGYTLGDKHLPLVSIVAGAHPDEPAGPIAALALAQQYRSDPLLHGFRFAVVPTMDVDGVCAQAEWLRPYDDQLDILAYLEHRIRRLPGADREFAWPGAPWGGTVLPECLAANTFLDAQGPALAHLSLHGMGIAHGAWFLLDHPALQDATLWSDLRQIAASADLGLHDSPRYGDKGFRRCAPGFCTTPSGSAMRRWALGDRRSEESSEESSERSSEKKNFADHFAFSSMDAARLRARSHGLAEKNMPLCAVSEFPLMALPFQDSGTQNDSWRELLPSLVLADNPQRALADFCQQFQLQTISLSTQVDSMVQMVAAVAAAAVRRG